MRAYVEIIRPINGFIIGLGVIAGMYIDVIKHPLLVDLIVGFLGGFFTCSSVMVINDIFDIEADKVNAPNRPLPSGRMSIRSATIYSCVLLFLALFLSNLLSIANLMLAALFWTMGVLYNWKLKSKGILGNLIVSLSVTAPFLYGNIVVNKSISPTIILFCLIAFFANMSREIIKAIADIRGDSLTGITTVPIKIGPQRAYLVGYFFGTIAITISPIPLMLNIVNITYVPLIACADIGMMYSLYLSSSLRKEDCIKSKTIMLYSMLIGTLAFLLGNLR
ncbi:MAG: UbiA family prenyltransferase [Candidatus Geothermarchaeota archaeon]